MCINVDKNCPLVTTLDNNALENVNDFKYLGSFIGESMKDFLRRQRQSWGMLVTNQDAYRAYVGSILLYGCET